jgi:hypothetical protein
VTRGARLRQGDPLDFPLALRQDNSSVEDTRECGQRRAALGLLGLEGYITTLQTSWMIHLAHLAERGSMCRRGGSNAYNITPRTSIAHILGYQRARGSPHFLTMHG